MIDDLIGTRLGQYELVELVRRGGMATVYKAHQPSLDRAVAVKVMARNRDPQFAARFKREARAIAQLQHPNILPVYDYGEQDGLLYLALQYVENGFTLTDYISGAHEPIAPATAVRLVRRILAGLEYAHGRGIVHRDIKPGNVLMPTPDWPMLADFGIAKLLNDASPQLTTPGLLVGTAAYMAPEQALSRPVDARTDIYAVGVMLYEMLTGRVPFDAEQPLAILTKHLHELPTPPTRLNPRIPTTVERLVMRTLAKEPDERFATAAELAAALQHVGSQLQPGDERAQLPALYQGGVQAFGDGRWDEAVDLLGRLVALDPAYEDASELLAAAAESSRRARADARQQIEQVRQRRSTAGQGSLELAGVAPGPDRAGGSANQRAAGAETAAGQTAPAARSTSRLEPAPAPPADTAANLVVVGASAGSAPPPSAPLAAPPAAEPVASAAAPAPGERPRPGRSSLPLMIGGAVAALLLAGLAFAALSRPGSPAPQPTAAAAHHATAAPPPQATAAAVAQATAPPPQATAQPAGAAPLPAPAGALALEEDFDAGGEQTGLVDRDDDLVFSRGFHPPGVYHFRLTRPGEERLALLPRQVYHDFTMQLELWDNSDDFVGLVAQGAVFRAQDGERFYALLVDPRAGRYMVRRHEGPGLVSELIPWTESPLIRRGADHNQVRIDAAGEAFTLFINGQQVASFSDGAYPLGMVGLITSNGDAAMPHMHFDNLAVWSAAPPQPGPELPPTRDTPAGEMVLIPGGPFVMGDNERGDAQPHLVDLPSFYIDRAEVSNAAYAACVGEGACSAQQSLASYTHPAYATQEEYGGYPALFVSWGQARAFCQWAGKRLPSEAEWEKAASWERAAGKQIWPWGNLFAPDRLNSDESGSGDTTPVDSHPPELNGTLHLAGNVSEWTSSLALPYPYSPEDGREDPDAGGDRVFRGGSWAQTQGKARSALRQVAPPSYADREIGFRCAATP